jgi:hypothetical protein
MTAAPRTRRLGLPSLPDHLPVVTLLPEALVRISRYHSGEPHFGRTGGNRFDDPERQYGTCYFGCSLALAMAETLLHDAVAVRGRFRVHPDSIASRFVLAFSGKPLRLADLTGASLKRMGGHAALSGNASYGLPQRWSQAVHRHPDAVDGFVYMSRHLNTEPAAVLFDRAGGKIRLATAIPLPSCPGFATAAQQLGIGSA